MSQLRIIKIFILRLIILVIYFGWSLGIESISLYIWISFFYDVLDPLFLNVAVNSLCISDIHRLHAFQNRLIILLMLLLVSFSPFSSFSTSTFSFSFLLLDWKIYWSSRVLFLPFFTIISIIRIFLFRISVLRVKFVVRIHHQLKELSFICVFLFLEDYVTQFDKIFLYLIIRYLFL